MGRQVLLDNFRWIQSTSAVSVDAGPDTILFADDTGPAALFRTAIIVGTATSYQWRLDGVVVATTPTVTTALSAGVHSLTFAASDGTRTVSDVFIATVIQPAAGAPGSPGPQGPQGPQGPAGEAIDGTAIRRALAGPNAVEAAVAETGWGPKAV